MPAELSARSMAVVEPGVICPHCGEAMPDAEESAPLQVGDLCLDPVKMLLTVGGKPAIWDTHGRAAPIRLLAVMMRRPGMVWSVTNLMDLLGLWDVQPSSMRVVAHRARKAIRASKSVRLTGLRGQRYTLEFELEGATK